MSPCRRSIGRAILVRWLVTVAWDFLCASGLSIVAYGSTFRGLWQGVAAAVLGPPALHLAARGVAGGPLSAPRIRTANARFVCAAVCDECHSTRALKSLLTTRTFVGARSDQLRPLISQASNPVTFTSREVSIPTSDILKFVMDRSGSSALTAAAVASVPDCAASPPSL